MVTIGAQPFHVDYEVRRVFGEVYLTQSTEDYLAIRKAQQAVVCEVAVCPAKVFVFACGLFDSSAAHFDERPITFIYALRQSCELAGGTMSLKTAKKICDGIRACYKAWGTNVGAGANGIIDHAVIDTIRVYPGGK